MQLLVALQEAVVELSEEIEGHPPTQNLDRCNRTIASSTQTPTAQDLARNLVKCWLERLHKNEKDGSLAVATLVRSTFQIILVQQSKSGNQRPHIRMHKTN